jgi:pSer/pThr/pTyr-binding forkhead associated (FHA) protein
MNRTLELMLNGADGSARSVRVELSDAKPHFVIGQADDADLCLKSPSLRPRHCRLSLGKAGVELANLADGPGVACNGRPVRTTTPVNDGDSIQFGELTARVVLR